MSFRLADLAMEFELERPPSIDDMLTVIINREDVEALIGRPVSHLDVHTIQIIFFFLHGSWYSHKNLWNF